MQTVSASFYEFIFLIVGVAGFEPTTPCSQSRCANRTALHPESFFIFQSPYLSKAMQRYGFFLYMQIFKAIFFYFFSHYYLSNYKSKH